MIDPHTADSNSGGVFDTPTAGAFTAGALLSIRGVSKHFGGSVALKDVDLDIMPGEIHGLLGANGSGKSTIIKILAGFHEPDAGHFWIHGQEVQTPFGAGGLRYQGVGFVHQDLGQVPNASVLEHMVLDANTENRGLTRINWRDERDRVQGLLDRYELDISLDAPIDALYPVQRALVAIVRAISAQEEYAQSGNAGATLLILDEPTVFLPKHEVDQLFVMMRRLKDQGSSVLFVSHDIDEVLTITDRVSVLRDGKNAGSRVTNETTREQIVEMILGGRFEHIARTFTATDESAQLVLSAVGLRGHRAVDVSFDVRRGEVVGVTGLAGSGFEEITDLIYGSRKLEGGSVLVHGSDVRKPVPEAMMNRGVVLIPADRKGQGGALSLTVLENMALPSLRTQSKGWLIRWRQLRERMARVCRELRVVPDNVGALFGNLSGGNQQKALMGKWLDQEPQLMLLNEPTQGVDIGARMDIFRLIRSAVDEKGMGVVCATSDYEQLVEIADRVLILSNGSIRGEIVGQEITKDALAAAIYAEEAA
jgi:ribose transport system ATP-binding protein